VTLVYATPDDLVPEWLTAEPPNAQRLLSSASRRVRNATVTAVYATTSVGLPIDSALVEALRDATCAQVAAWATVGIDPLAGGVQLGQRLVASKSLGSGSIAYDNGAAGSVTAMEARAAAATGLAPEAASILRDAGLLGGPAWTHG
jgi:hypothetical protein